MKRTNGYLDIVDSYPQGIATICHRAAPDAIDVFNPSYAARYLARVYMNSGYDTATADRPAGQQTASGRHVRRICWDTVADYVQSAYVHWRRSKRGHKGQKPLNYSTRRACRRVAWEVKNERRAAGYLKRGNMIGERALNVLSARMLLRTVMAPVRAAILDTLPFPADRSRAEQRTARILSILASGTTIEHCADMVGVSRKTVQRDLSTYADRYANIMRT